MAEPRSLRPAIAGFTLIEMLVSIAILGLILTALMGGVGFAGRAWGTQESRMAKNGDLDSVHAILRRLIATGREFDGDEEAVHFVSRLPDALGRPGLFDCELRVSSDRFVLAWWPHRRTPEIVDPTVTELAAHVAGMRLAYFVPVDGGVPAWQDTVKPADDAPRLIGIVLTTSDGRVRPPLIVAPAIEQPPGKGR